MKPIRKILLAVKDTKRRSSPELSKAATLARALGAELELFHAITTPLALDALTGTAMQKLQDAESARHLQRLERMAASLRRRGIKVGTAVEWDYPSSEAVVRRARSTRAGLIVAGRHGSPHVARWLLRYTDWELLRQSPVPVLLVKKPRPWRSPGILAAVDPSHAFAKTAQLDKAILELGACVGTATRGAVHVLHAYVPTAIGMKESQLIAPDATRRIVDAATAQAEKRLDKALRSARMGKLAPARRHLLPLHPVNSIPGLARRLGSDVVVMGAISRSGVKGLLIGNTAERLLDELPCDLLIVKPPGFASTVPPRVRGPDLFLAGPPSGMVF
jgi:universal stress protein E